MRHFRKPPILFVTVGPPGCGKSTFAKRLQEIGVEWLSRDEVRTEGGDYSREKELEVVAILIHLARIKLLDGRHVVIDANHVQIDQRNEIFDLAKKLWGQYGLNICKVALFFPNTLETCLERKRSEIEDPNRGLTQDVVISQYNKLVEPTTQEGFHVYAVDALKTHPEDLVEDREVLPHKRLDYRCA